MKKYFFLFLAAATFILNSCSKIEEVQENPLTGTVLFSGSFTSGAHTTSGTVEVLKVNGVNKLSFKNVKTDAGPDLRIYMSQDINAKTFTEITNKVNNGTYALDIPANVDPAKNKFVLIWCKQFSVLFGSAELK